MPEDEAPGSQWKRFTRLKRPTVKTVRTRARKIEGATLRHAHRFIISRWTNLREVRRLALGWMALASLLVIVTGVQLFWVQNAYSSQQSESGGTYAEGVIGRLDTLNPIYATTQSERSASRLIFSSLVRYDTNNALVGDIATTWQASNGGKTYVVQLRKDAKWHDGESLTADDVVYTLDLIKNPQTRSYLYLTWHDIGVKKLDKYRVQFDLPSAYAPFPHALTFGILPEHVLQDTPPARLRESAFNKKPVGSGPFVFRAIQIINIASDRVVLQVERNDNYYEGKYKLERFQLHTYKSHDDLRQGFLTREINAANDLTSADINTIKEQAPSTKVDDARIEDGVYAFFQNDNPVLKDVAVRKALVLATDRKSIRSDLGGYNSPLEGPLLSSQTYNLSDLKQAGYDAQNAAKVLDEAGWVMRDGVRQKDGVRLQLNVIAPRSGDFPKLLGIIAKQWRAIGVDARTQAVETSAFERNILTGRSYDVLLYELALGADPDVFAYWHSSQANSRGYNLSNYRSGVSDDALLSARGRSETDLRATKYRNFFKQWLEDAPAVALYQPHLRYVTTATTTSIDSSKPVVDMAGRYHSLDQWSVNTAQLYKSP
jgi:peptide/nickel transport system substrate-binding protein